jgi:hypothetical protein
MVENSQLRNFEKNWLTIHSGMKYNATSGNYTLPLIIAANQHDSDLNLRHTNNNLRHPKGPSARLVWLVTSLAMVE